MKNQAQMGLHQIIIAKQAWGELRVERVQFAQPAAGPALRSLTKGRCSADSRIASESTVDCISAEASTCLYYSGCPRWLCSSVSLAASVRLSPAQQPDLYALCSDGTVTRLIATAKWLSMLWSLSPAPVELFLAHLMGGDRAVKRQLTELICRQ